MSVVARHRPAARTWPALVAAAAVLVATVSFSQAAGLALNAAAVTSQAPGHPCPGQATATAATGSGTTYSAVSITVPSLCAGKPLFLTLLNGSTVLRSGNANVAGSGATTVTFTGTYTASSSLTVQAVVDGWNLPVSWSYTAPPPAGPVYPGNAGTVTSNLVWTLVTNNPVQVCFVVDVTTTSTTPVVWRLTLDLAQAPFNGATTDYKIQGSDGWHYEQYASTPSAGYLQIGGDANHGRRTIIAGQTYQVTVCHDGLPPGAQTPSAYAVTTVQGMWTDTRACLVTTVTGNGSSPFYFGWTVPLDMQSAVSRLQSAGRTFDAFTYSSNHWQQTWTPAPDVGPYGYRVVSNTAANIAGTESYVFETCAVDW